VHPVLSVSGIRSYVDVVLYVLEFVSHAVFIRLDGWVIIKHLIAVTRV